MSVETDPIPPVPEHTPPIQEDANAGGSRRFSQTWTRWFVSLREKVNVINDTVSSLSQLIGSGIVTVDGSGNATTVQTTDLVQGSNINFTGSGVNRILDDGSGPLTINASGGGGGASVPAMLNPLQTGGSINLSAGNLVATKSGTNVWQSTRAHGEKFTGKWYFESEILVIPTTIGQHMVGFKIPTSTTVQYPGQMSNEVSIQTTNPDILLIQNGVTSTVTGYGSVAVNDRISVAVDLDNGHIWINIIGRPWIGGGNPETGVTPTKTFTPNISIYPAIGLYGASPSVRFISDPSALTGPVPASFTPGWPVQI